MTQSPRPWLLFAAFTNKGAMEACRQETQAALADATGDPTVRAYGTELSNGRPAFEIKHADRAALGALLTPIATGHPAISVSLLLA